MRGIVTLGIETSCDETSCAVVRAGEVLSNEVSSSVELHAAFGGVVPEIASRYHLEYVLPVYRRALAKAGVEQGDIELISVTCGPGLPGSLMVGLSFAKSLAAALDVPIVGVSHLTGHALSAFIGKRRYLDELDRLEYTALVVSGGHSSIYFSRGDSCFDLAGRTLDDAAGEAFDKAAKVLGLGYPGGPAIENCASRFDGTNVIAFPRAKLKDPADLDMSFSGLKTAVLYHWRKAEHTDREKARVSFSFQEAVVDVLVEKAARAIRRSGHKLLVAGGGVICNRSLREALQGLARDEGAELLLPGPGLAGDNAGMIAFCGERAYLKGARSDLCLRAAPALIR